MRSWFGGWFGGYLVGMALGLAIAGWAEPAFVSWLTNWRFVRTLVWREQLANLETVYDSTGTPRIVGGTTLVRVTGSRVMLWIPNAETQWTARGGKQ